MTDNLLNAILNVQLSTSFRLEHHHQTTSLSEFLIPFYRSHQRALYEYFSTSVANEQYNRFKSKERTYVIIFHAKLMSSHLRALLLSVFYLAPRYTVIQVSSVISGFYAPISHVRQSTSTIGFFNTLSYFRKYLSVINNLAFVLR